MPIPGFEGSYTVVAIGPNGAGELAMLKVAGHDFSAEPKFHSRQDAERERGRLLEQWGKGGIYRPDFWSSSLRLEIWTLAQTDDAWNSGKYSRFF
jgi:hypothetical protein